jgi:hypothetical protein
VIDMRREWWVVAICLAMAGFFVFAWTDTARLQNAAFDLYWEYYPNMVYAARQFWRGGSGLLWNPLQSCGQPFFGNSSTALLYPANWFFLVLPADAALLAVTAFNLTVGGVGAYLLTRELGAAPIAAVCGAVAFELANEVIDTSTWMPLINAPIMWLPAALWLVERILKQPSLRLGIGLAVVLALALLNGFPQPLLFGYQMIALRVVWEVVTGHVRHIWRTLAIVGIGLALPPLLTAVHFVPGAEMASLSVRSGPLSLAEIMGEGALTWADFRARFGRRVYLMNPISTVPFLIALASLFSSSKRRVVLFYAVVAVVFFILAFGPATPLFDWYLLVPINRTFRNPGRSLWITGLCLSILTGLGADHLIARQRAASPRWFLSGCLVAAAVALHLLSTTGLHAGEILLAFVVILIAAGPTERTGWPALAVPAVIALSLMAFQLRSIPSGAWTLRPAPYRALLNRSSVLGFAMPAFDWLHRNMTPQERVYIMEGNGQMRLIPKSASLFELRSVHDYEPAPTRRSAAYQVMMRTGRQMTNLNAFYFQVGQLELPLAPLLNLAAGKYLLIDSTHASAAAIARTYRARYSGRNVAFYENPDALPRAFFVPQLAVVPDEHAVLDRLARGRERRTDIALVEEAPPSGFVGEPGPIDAPPVEFITDEPERVVLRVQAPRRGFVHLADQFFPGWRATVNDEPAPILRGNFLFRLVEVPAGDSTVEFRYQPMSLRLGAMVSLLTIAATLLVIARRSTFSTER